MAVPPSPCPPRPGAEAAPVASLGAAGDRDGEDEDAEDPGAGLALGQQEGRHLVPARGPAADCEGLARHEVHAGLGELLVEGEQRLLLVRPRGAVCGGPGDTRRLVLLLVRLVQT